MEALTAPFSLLPSSLSLSKGSVSARPALPPFCTHCCLLSHKYGLPSSLTIGIDVGGRAVEYISSQSLPISQGRAVGIMPLQ